jgi:hypothetical protein
MKSKKQLSEQGSVLVMAMLTITILTMICATSLYVASQNASTGMQTASWQQSLTGAESGIDKAIAALNTGTYTGWYRANTGTLPTVEPSPGASPTPATAAPDASQYLWLPSSQLTVSMTGTEGATSVSSWVTIDTAGMLTTQDTNGQQWYRLRSTGQAAVAGPSRVSANTLDNNLRNTIALRFNRKGGSTLGPTRTIEVIMQPLASSLWVRGITAVNWISMSGSGVVDSFDSTSAFKSTNGAYDASKRQNHGDMATTNSTSSDLRSTYVYGSVAYSGPAIKNTTNVQGTIATPGPSTPPAVSAPTWAAGTYTTYSGGGSSPPNAGVFNAGNKNSPTYIKVNGDLTVSSSGNPLNILQHDTSGSASNPGDQIFIWVTGKLTTSGSGYINQDNNVQVTWYVGGDITISGSSYSNTSGRAANLSINGYGTNNKFTDSGSGSLIATVNAPKYATTISGGGDFMGGLIADTLTISGSGSFHYDESLKGGGSPAIGNYAFASWFEDNSDKARLISY